MEKTTIHPILPYFTFFHPGAVSVNPLYLYVHIDRVKFTDAKFELRDNEVLISTNDYKNKKYIAKIYLPVKVIQSRETDLPTEYSSGCYMLSLKIDVEQLNCTKIPDLDLLSCHLAWRDQTIREQPDSLGFGTSTPDTTDKVMKSLAALKLSDNEKPRVGFYGFACRYTKKGNDSSAIELCDPDSSDPEERLMLRWESERQSFDVEHYLADFFFEQPEHEEDSTFRQTIFWNPYWHRVKRASAHKFKTHQMRLLAELPCKEFNLSGKERLEVLHSLLEIILAYAYDHRLTFGKHNSESAWNINKLSATLSWFQVHEHVGDAVHSFMSRSLTYPLYRSWLLSWLAYKDALEIFNLGRRQILNCLVAIHDIFNADEDRKCLNELYINDYLIWVQQVHPKTIRNYVKHIRLCSRIKKENVICELPHIEEAAIAVMKEHEEEYELWNRDMEEYSNFVFQRQPVNRGLRVYHELQSDSSSSDSDDSSGDLDDIPEFDILFSKRRAENITRILITLSGIVGFIWDYTEQKFSYTVYSLSIGFMIAALLTLPPWPIYRQKPLNWQKVKEKSHQKKKK